ncbi:YibE/F family protein [Mediterraneibacter glycyrrhizinilyticus]|uniref:YibE/F family protein n=1 Tax=Mediterraneibacter glycyrrhizinilyticus TaxID=342942 RepID=UPI0025A360E5|nr:YibE/F family protein [Mediterraneibacter glycyrrhizinilyticus]MDM8210859.1 YibE/F family protein [Mediterraneibacter glycyrrhizinilyticus]
MKNKRLNVVIRVLPVVIVLAILAGIAMWINRANENETTPDSGRLVYAPAKVTAVLSDNAQEDFENAEGRRVGDQELEIQILSGDHKDEIMTVTNYMSALFNVDVQQGDRIIVRIMTDENGSYYASVFNYDRGIVLGGFLLIFFILLGALGGKKGLGALAGLLLTLGCIWFILIPCLLRGVPAIPVTIAVSAVSAAAGLIFLNGYSKKTFCAVCGCVGGVLVSGIAAAVVGTLSPMNGFNMQEAENLILYGADQGLKVSGLLVCGVLISALGAVMDVALGIASSVWEMKEQNPDASVGSLFRSGMQIGKDAMGTMANTLILAFAGSSLNMLILVQTYNIPFLQLINTDSIALEVVQSVAGSIGILLTVPLVALISARLMARRKKAGV